MKSFSRSFAALLALLSILTGCTDAPADPTPDTTASPTEVLVPPETAAQPTAEETIASPIDGEMTTRISFVAAGDNIIHEAVFTDAKANAAA